MGRDDVELSVTMTMMIDYVKYKYLDWEEIIEVIFALVLRTSEADHFSSLSSASTSAPAFTRVM